MRLTAGNLGANRIGWLAAFGLALALVMAVALSRGPAIEVGSLFSSPSSAEVDSNYGQLPLAFEPNAGRMREGVDFVTHTSAGSVALVGGGAVLSSRGGRSDRRSHRRRLRQRGEAAAEASRRRQRPHGEAGAGRDHEDPDLRAGSLPALLPGNRRRLVWQRGTLEYDFRVAAGADPSQIAVRLARCRGPADRRQRRARDRHRGRLDPPGAPDGLPAERPGPRPS